MARGGDLGRISIEIEARLAKFESDIGRAARILEREMARSAKASERAIAEMTKRFEMEAKRMEKIATRTAGVLVGVFSVNFLADFARGIARMNDGFINVQAQLRQVTNNQKELAKATQDTFAVSQRTYASFESTGNLVGRVSRALISSGRDQNTALQQSLRFSEAINNAFILSGAKAIEAKNAILQLSQGLASGTLRGDEYRSVAEQGAKVTEILAKNLTEVNGNLELANGRLGITTGRLRELAYEGKLTTDLVVGAMSAGFEELAFQVGTIPLTIERAFVQLSNAAENYIGTSTNIVAINAQIAETVAFVARNFEALADAALYTAAAIVAVITSRTINMVAEYIKQLAAQRALMIQSAAATVKKAQAAQLEAASELATANAIMRKNAADLNDIRLAATKVSQAMTYVKAMIAQQQALAAATNGGYAYVQYMKAAKVMKAQLIVLTELQTKATVELAAAERAAAASSAGVALAGNKYAAAARGAGVASAELAAKTSLLRSSIAGVAGGLTALAGGPLGLAILGVAALGYAASEVSGHFQEMREAALENSIALEGMNEVLKEQLETYLARAAGMTVEEKKIQDAFVGSALEVEQLTAKLASMQALYTSMGGGREGRPLLEGIADTTEDLNRAKQALSDLQDTMIAIGFARMEAELQTLAQADAQRQMNEAGQISAAQNRDITDSLNDQIEKLKLTNIELKEGLRARLIAQAVIEGELTSSELLTSAMLEQIDTIVRLTNENEKLGATKRTNRQIERDERRASRDAIRDAKLQAKALEEQADAYKRLALMISGGSVSDPMQAALEENARLQEDFNEAIEDLVKLGPPTAEAYDLIAAAAAGLATQQERNLAEARKAENIYAQVIGDLERQAMVLGMTTEEAEAYEIIQRAINDAIAINKPLSDEQIASLEREVPARLAAIRAMEAQIAVQERVNSTIIQGAYAAGDAWAEFIADGASDFKSFAQQMEDIAKRMVAQLLTEFAKLQFINPLLNNLLGTSLPTGGGGGNILSTITSMFGGQSGGGGNILSTITSLFGGGSSAAIGSAAASYGVFNPAITSGMGSYGVAATATGAGNAATAGVGGAASSVGWVPIVGWIVAAMAANDRFFSEGWRREGGSTTLPNGQVVSGGGNNSAIGELVTAGLVNGLDSALQRLGFSDRIASLLSGSSVHARLFGRKPPRVTNGETTFNFGADGVGGMERYRTLEEGGVFRSDRRRWHQFGLSGDSLEAAQGLFDDLQNIMSTSAQRLRTEAPDMIDSALRIVQEFDKKGKVKATKYFVDVLGRSWEEATAELAQSRLGAEALIATIDSVLGDASEIAERWRSDAEQLLVGAQFLMNVATDLRTGFDLLGTGTLTPIVELVEELAAEGESLEQTYTRLAMSTALFESAVATMGAELDYSREAFVRLAVDITEAAGGLEAAQNLWTSFFENFYSDNERSLAALTALSASAGEAFRTIGLDSGSFSDGAGGMARFRELFESQIPTLTGAQIVQWLEAAAALAALNDAQAAYNELLGITGEVMEASLEAFMSYAEAVMSINDQIAQMEMSEFQYELREIAQSFTENTERLNELARAAGLSAAREEDLARAHQLAAMQAARAIAQLEARGRALANELGYGALGGVEAAIAELEARSNTATDTVRDFGDAIQETTDTMRNNIDLLLGDLSPLKDAQKLPIALRALEAGQIGPEDVLRIGRRLFASGQDYNSLFDQVMAIGDRRSQGTSPSGPTGSVSTGTVRNAELEALYAERDRLMAQQDEAERFLQANELAQIIADLAGARGISFEEAADLLGIVDLGQVATDLRLDGLEPLIEFLTALQADTYSFEEIGSRITAGSQAIIDALYDIFERENQIPSGPLGGDGTKPGGSIGIGGVIITDDQPFDPPTVPVPVEDVDPMPDPERPVDREIVDRIIELGDNLINALTQVVDNTGTTAEGIGTLATVAEGERLERSIGLPRSQRFEKAR
jgi:tape measure domain-containing protein